LVVQLLDGFATTSENVRGMSRIRSRATTARWHRRMGLFLSVPLVLWIVSAFLLHYFGLTMPNGLQGVYRLSPYNSVDVELSTARIQPDSLLAKLRTHYELDEIYWLKLQSRGQHLWYVVKPNPFSTGMVFDARTGERLDPLSDEKLEIVANETLSGTQAVSMSSIDEYHRDYTLKKVSAVKVIMEGEQPTELILSRHTGRTLRRSDEQAQQFNWWYKTVHVFQWGDSMAFFTTILYLVAACVVVLAIFGLRLWWQRRGQAKNVYQKRNLKTRRLHRRLGIVVGTLVFAQMFLGVYMWLSLGPLRDPFRGKNTFNDDWTGGISTSADLPDMESVLSRIVPFTDSHAHPIQSIQWRMLGEKAVCIINWCNNETGEVFDLQTGQPMGDLSPEAAGRAAQRLMKGALTFEFRGENSYYNNDLNRKIPTYHFRFADASATDVFVSKKTGDIISRRTRFWRAFSPILTFHAYAFTGNAVIDTVVLSIFQIGLLALIITGWIMNFTTKPSQKEEKMEM
ncbi:MAG: PepSY domain-containing protein, partial [bacterium]